MILLFLVLGWCMLVVAIQAHDRYITLVLANITVWIVGQAFVNIGVVVGLFPVMGVPLPFVSAGGSSLILCLGAAGVTVSMMETAAADSSGDSAGLKSYCCLRGCCRMRRHSNVDEM